MLAAMDYVSSTWQDCLTFKTLRGVKPAVVPSHSRQGPLIGLLNVCCAYSSLGSSCLLACVWHVGSQ